MMLWDRGGLERNPGRQILPVFLLLSLTLLACALFEPTTSPVSDRIVNRAHLPTLTPTLTPISAALTIAAPAVLPSPVPPTPTLAPAIGDAPAPPNNQNNNAPSLSPPQTGSSVDNAQTLPTQTPPPSLATPTPIPTLTIIPASPTTVPVTQPPQAPTLTPTPLDWAFSHIRLDTEQAEDSLIVYGNMINNSGAAQEVAFISGAFYDGQGQMIADEADTYDRWLIGVVPPGGQMPFELTVPGIRESADIKLRVEAAPSDESPWREFEFLETNSSTEWGDYCLSSVLRNPGERLQEYLIIGVILYDAQDKVINFNSYEEFDFEQISEDQTLAFEVCVDPLDQAVARYELQAWGL